MKRSNSRNRKDSQTSSDRHKVKHSGSSTKPSTGVAPSSRDSTEFENDLAPIDVIVGTEIDLNESIGTTDTAIATEEAQPFFPPTDPPTRTVAREDGGIEVVGGFTGTSLDAPVDLEELPPNLSIGDDEIARQVRLALLDDAGTTDLQVRVIVRDGVVVLRGVVDSLNDAELAVQVASELPSVIDVVDELEVPGV